MDCPNLVEYWQPQAEGEHSYHSVVRAEDQVAYELAIDTIIVESEREQIFRFYKCKMCPYRTKSFTLIRSHLKRHKITRHSKSFNCLSVNLEQYKCNKCEYRTPYLINFNKHVKTSHPNDQVKDESESTMPKLEMMTWRSLSKIYSCDNCSFTTYSQLYYVAHYRTCPVKLFVKQNNKERLKKQEEIIKWRKKQDKLRFEETIPKLRKRTPMSYEEQIDPEEIVKENKGESGRSRKKHIRKTRTKGSYTNTVYCCWKCPFKSFFVSGYVNHLYHRHVGDGDIKWIHCDICPYKSVFAAHLKRHMRSKHPSGVKCSMCSFHASTRIKLKVHILEKHISKAPPIVLIEDLKKYKCTSCDFKSADHVGLKEHFLTNHVSTETVVCFKCGMCSFVTIEEEKIKEHVLEHVDPQGLTWTHCEMCELKFRTREELKKHIFDKHIL